MRLLGVTDLHDRPKALERILADAGNVDLILLGGDITNFGLPDDAQRLVGQARLSGTPVLAVAGNCDSAAIDRRLVEMGVSLHGRGVVHSGLRIQGLSAMPPWRSSMYQFTEQELAEFLRVGAEILQEGAELDGEGVHVVLSHPPPRGGRLDRTRLLKHVGSTALQNFIATAQPSLVVCGHIHEGRGIDHFGPTTVVNCGLAASGYYALAEVGEEVKVELRRA